jgi:RimK family alpha-L-glutamate ligase
MKRKGLCVLNAYQTLEGLAHFADRMSEELAKFDVTLERRTNAELLCLIGEDGNVMKRFPFDADFILYLDKDFYMSHLLEKIGYRLFDTADAIALCDDKMLTHLALAGHGIKMPKTVPGPLNYSVGISMEFIRNLEATLPFPMVSKEIYGSLGRDVFLLQKEEDLIAFETERRQDPRLYQEFIASSYGFDYRLIVIGGHYFTGMKRVNGNGDFRSNIASGGHGERVSMPLSFIDMAQKAASVLNLDYCGADILQGPSGEPILCEVNSNAFVSGIEKTTGLNVAGAYAAHIVKTIYGK